MGIRIHAHITSAQKEIGYIAAMGVLDRLLVRLSTIYVFDRVYNIIFACAIITRKPPEYYVSPISASR